MTSPFTDWQKQRLHNTFLPTLELWDIEAVNQSWTSRRVQLSSSYLHQCTESSALSLIFCTFFLGWVCRVSLGAITAATATVVCATVIIFQFFVLRCAAMDILLDCRWFIRSVFFCSSLWVVFKPAPIDACRPLKSREIHRFNLQLHSVYDGYAQRHKRGAYFTNHFKVILRETFSLTNLLW